MTRRIQLLDDEHAEKERTIEQQLSEIDALKAQQEIEIERLKAEITSLETKYQNELEDERDQYSHVILQLTSHFIVIFNISMKEYKLEFFFLFWNWKLAHENL